MEIQEVKKKKLFKRTASLDRRKARAGWLFVLPFVIGFVFLYVPVILDSLVLTFCKIGIGKYGNVYVEYAGGEFFREAFSNQKFIQSLLSGVQQLIFSVPAIVIFSLFVAVILNQKMLGRAAFRAIFFIPVIISTGLMDAINAADSLQEDMENGSAVDMGGAAEGDSLISTMDIENLLGNLKVGSELVVYVTQLVNDIYDIVNRSGVQMLIFLAGLQSISPAIYEASSIEGATAWETFWKITFPMISPMILVNTIYTIIDSFTSKSNVVMTFISGIYSGTGENVATVMYWTYFLMVMAIIGIFAAIASTFVFYQRRD